MTENSENGGTRQVTAEAMAGLSGLLSNHLFLWRPRSLPGDTENTVGQLAILPNAGSFNHRIALSADDTKSLFEIRAVDRKFLGRARGVLEGSQLSATTELLILPGDLSELVLEGIPSLDNFRPVSVWLDANYQGENVRVAWLTSNQPHQFDQTDFSDATGLPLDQAAAQHLPHDKAVEAIAYRYGWDGDRLVLGPAEEFLHQPVPLSGGHADYVVDFSVAPQAGRYETDARLDSFHGTERERQFIIRRRDGRSFLPSSLPSRDVLDEVATELTHLTLNHWISQLHLRSWLAGFSQMRTLSYFSPFQRHGRQPIANRSLFGSLQRVREVFDLLDRAFQAKKLFNEVSRTTQKLVAHCIRNDRWKWERGIDLARRLDSQEDGPISADGPDWTTSPLPRVNALGNLADNLPMTLGVTTFSEIAAGLATVPEGFSLEQARQAAIEIMREVLRPDPGYSRDALLSKVVSTGPFDLLQFYRVAQGASHSLELRKHGTIGADAKVVFIEPYAVRRDHSMGVFSNLYEKAHTALSKQRPHADDRPPAHGGLIASKGPPHSRWTYVPYLLRNAYKTDKFLPDEIHDVPTDAHALGQRSRLADDMVTEVTVFASIDGATRNRPEPPIDWMAGNLAGIPDPAVSPSEEYATDAFENLLQHADVRAVSNRWSTGYPESVLALRDGDLAFLNNIANTGGPLKEMIDADLHADDLGKYFSAFSKLDGAEVHRFLRKHTDPGIFASLGIDADELPKFLEKAREYVTDLEEDAAQLGGELSDYHSFARPLKSVTVGPPLVSALKTMAGKDLSNKGCWMETFLGQLPNGKPLQLRELFPDRLPGGTDPTSIARIGELAQKGFGRTKGRNNTTKLAKALVELWDEYSSASTSEIKALVAFLWEKGKPPIDPETFAQNLVDVLDQVNAATTDIDAENLLDSL